jgi:hypothetical protein
MGVQLAPFTVSTEQGVKRQEVSKVIDNGCRRVDGVNG